MTTKTPEALIHKLILAGDDTNTIMEKVKAAFPEFKFTNRTVSFHRTLLRKLGHKVERAGRNDKGTPRGANKRTTAAAKTPAKKPAAKKPAAKKAPVKKPAAKRPAAKKPAARKPAASKATAKTSKRGAKK